MSDTAQHSYKPTIFADVLTDVIIANGVARMTLASVASDGKPAAVASLCIPVMQLPVFAAGIAKLIQQMQEKAKEARAAAAASTTTPTE